MYQGVGDDRYPCHRVAFLKNQTEVTAVLIDNTCNMNAESLVVFKINCLHFYIEVLNQINKRFPFDSEFCKSSKELGFLNLANLSGA